MRGRGHGEEQDHPDTCEVWYDEHRLGIYLERKQVPTRGSNQFLAENKHVGPAGTEQRRRVWKRDGSEQG